MADGGIEKVHGNFSLHMKIHAKHLVDTEMMLSEHRGVEVTRENIEEWLSEAEKAFVEAAKRDFDVPEDRLSDDDCPTLDTSVEIDFEARETFSDEL